MQTAALGTSSAGTSTSTSAGGSTVLSSGWTPPSAPSSIQQAMSYPQASNVHFVQPGGASSAIQTALDTYKIVRLEAADYTAKGTISVPVVMKSGYQLYGLPGTAVSTLTIEPGATGVVVSGVNGNMIFPSPSSVGPSTHDNLFRRIGRGNITVQAGAIVENNIFLDCNYCSYRMDTSVAVNGSYGYVRNNRFIFTRAQGAAPDITLIGDTGRLSYGNVFLWKNFLTPANGGAYLLNQKDLSFVGFAGERWETPLANSPASSTNNFKSLIYTGAMGTLRAFGASGGDSYLTNFNIGADEFQLYDADFSLAARLSIKLTASTANSLSFSWSAPYAALNGYAISYAQGSVAPATCATKLGNVTTDTLQGLSSGTTYSVALCSLDSNNVMSAPVTLSVSTAPGTNSVVANSSYENGVILQSTNKRSLMSSFKFNASPIADNASGATRFNFFSKDVSATTLPLVVNGSTPSSSIPASADSALSAMLNPTSADRTGQPWERPSFATLPDPAGPHWNTIPSGVVDSTAYIQTLVNAGISSANTLPAGIYYISKPIVMHKGQALIGSGAYNTAIIAMTSDIDIIEGNLGGTYNEAATGNIHVMDITLQGGLNGIHFNNPGDQISDSVISHVTFRNMSVAGLSVDFIYGMDNNFFDNLNFVNCTTGVKQIPDPSFPALPPQQTNTSIDGSTTMAYIDKTVFYQSQFVSNGIGVDMQAGRADGLDAFINCQFESNTTMAGIFWGQNNLLVANSNFINNKGTTTWSSNAMDMTSCYFEDDGNAGTAILGGGFSIEGSEFHRTSNSTAVLLGSAIQGTVSNFRSSSTHFINHFYNTQSDMPIGNEVNGLLLNSLFKADSGLNQQGVLFTNGKASTFLPVTTTENSKLVPNSQLLFGETFTSP